MEINPNDLYNNSGYAAFLNFTKKNPENAEKFYLKALEADPNHARTNSNYAQFLKCRKNDPTLAEKFYLKAIANDPTDCINHGNYAQLLLEAGKIQEAKVYIQAAFNSKEEKDLLIELWFYRYAHYPEYLEEAEKKIEELLEKGLRSIDWDFDGNIKQALLTKHSNPEKLKEFAKRITTK